MNTKEEEALFSTETYVRAVVAYGDGSKVVHVVSVYVYSGAASDTKKMRANEQMLRNTFQFLAGLGAVPVILFADLNVVPSLSFAVRSAIETGG